MRRIESEKAGGRAKGGRIAAGVAEVFRRRGFVGRQGGGAREVRGGGAKGVKEGSADGEERSEGRGGGGGGEGGG